MWRYRDDSRPDRQWRSQRRSASNPPIMSALIRWCRGELRGNAVAERWRFLRAEQANNAPNASNAWQRVAPRRAEAPRRRVPPRSRLASAGPGSHAGWTRWWDAPTVANPQIGRAGQLTLAQTWRADGGRWGDR